MSCCMKSLPFLPFSSLLLAWSVPSLSLDNWGYYWYCRNRLIYWNCRCGLLPERAFPLVVSLLTTMVAAISGWYCSGSSLSHGALDLLPDLFCTLIYLLHEPVSALLEVYQGLLLQVVK